MRKSRTLAWLGLFASGLLTSGLLRAQPAPTSQEQAHTLDAARTAALRYAKGLPDFLCTETVQRFTMLGRSVRSSDKLTIQLSYSEQKENYKLVAIDGAATQRPFSSLEGLISGGEFGTLLFRIFDPASQAQFQWKRWTSVDKRKASVYSYTVARTHSHYTVGYRSGTGEMRTGTVGQTGLVTLDAETSQVLRLTAEAAEIGKDIAVMSASTSVDYEFVKVAGGTYLLPVKADSEMVRAQQESLKNLVTFAAYRKFEADSSIDFGGGDKKK